MELDEIGQNISLEYGDRLVPKDSVLSPDKKSQPSQTIELKTEPDEIFVKGQPETIEIFSMRRSKRSRKPTPKLLQLKSNTESSKCHRLEVDIGQNSIPCKDKTLNGKQNKHTASYGIQTSTEFINRFGEEIFQRLSVCGEQLTKNFEFLLDIIPEESRQQKKISMPRVVIKEKIEAIVADFVERILHCISESEIFANLKSSNTQCTSSADKNCGTQGENNQNPGGRDLNHDFTNSSSRKNLTVLPNCDSKFANEACITDTIDEEESPPVKESGTNRMKRQQTISKQMKRTGTSPCKLCEACLRPDCGVCKYCLDKVKFGGPNKLRMTCLERRCIIKKGKSHSSANKQKRKSIQCSICQLWMSSGNYHRHMKKHLKSKIKQPKVQCLKCDGSFMFQRDLAKHMKQVHDSGPSGLLTKRDLVDETEAENLPKAAPRTCPVCKLTSPDLSSDDLMKSHLSKHLIYDVNKGKILTQDGQDWTTLLKEIPSAVDVDDWRSSTEDPELDTETLGKGLAVNGNSETPLRLNVNNEKKTTTDLILSASNETHASNLSLSVKHMTSDLCLRASNENTAKENGLNVKYTTAADPDYGKGNSCVSSLIRHDDFTFTCLLCNVKFIYFLELKSHRNYHHKDINRSKLQYVGHNKEFLQLRNYKKHYGKKMCEKCGKNVDGKSFSQHLRMHANIYECEICHLQMSNSYSLAKHKRIHTRKDGDQPFMCDTCGKGFWYKYSLKAHCMIHTGGPGLKYKCGSCQERFSSQIEYKNHLQEHKRNQEIPDIVCDTCGESFSRPGDLKLHKLKKHFLTKPKSEESSFTCDICQKTFSSKFGLKQHKTVHSTVRPFSCDICKLTFKRKYALLAHKTIHADDKGHECNVCHKKFRLRRNLLQHYSIHTGDKPHCCPVCEQSFRLKQDMHQHLKRHAYRGECSSFSFTPAGGATRTYYCPVCRRSFISKIDLNYHLKKYAFRGECSLDVTVAADVTHEEVIVVTSTGPTVAVSNSVEME